MDPDEILASMRRLLEKAGRMIEAGHAEGEEYVGVLEAIAEHSEALDQWMTGGGFPPEAWPSNRYGFLDEQDEVVRSLHDRAGEIERGECP